MNARLSVDFVRDAQMRLDAIGDRARAPEPALRSRSTLQALQASERRRFAGNRFRANTAKWTREKRRRGLSPKRLQASGLLRLILEAGAYGTSNSAIRFTAFNGVLTWGLKGGRTVVYYARIWADRDRRRRPVFIDKHARVDINRIVTAFVLEGELS